MTLRKSYFKILLPSFLFLLISIFCISFFMLKPVFAETRTVRVTPVRVVLDGRKRVAKFRMLNTNDKSCRFGVSLVSMQMDDYGRCKEVELLTDKDMATKKMIRFSPRRASLEPRAWQTIRLMVRKPSGLADGEYRVNIKFAPSSDFTKVQNKNQTQKGVSADLNYVINVSVPIIIRHGTSGFVKIVPQKPILKTYKNKDGFFLEIELLREGSYSFYGDIIVYHIGSKKEREIGLLRGISIYASNEKQIVKVPVSDIDLKLLSKGMIKIEVINCEKEGEPVISSESFDLP